MGTVDAHDTYVGAIWEGTMTLNTKELLKRLTLPEKIGQMMQLSPWFFVADLDKEAAGPIRDLKLDEAKIFAAGTALGIGDAREMIAVQKKYLAKNRLGIPLLFG
ncbi:MAG: hypothetical protein Q8N15_01920, partial [Bacillota bacterium]|nr:hypothetical protein [Bacillota bacterium]